MAINPPPNVPTMPIEGFDSDEKIDTAHQDKNLPPLELNIDTELKLPYLIVIAQEKNEIPSVYWVLPIVNDSVSNQLPKVISKPLICLPDNVKKRDQIEKSANILGYTSEQVSYLSSAMTFYEKYRAQYPERIKVMYLKPEDAAKSFLSDDKTVDDIEASIKYIASDNSNANPLLEPSSPSDEDVELNIFNQQLQTAAPITFSFRSPASAVSPSPNLATPAPKLNRS